MNCMWAHLENNVVKELTDIDPYERYPENFEWVVCNGVVEVGYQLKDGNFFPPEPIVVVLDKAYTEVQRLLAYSNPITGSDRYFCEVLSLQAEGFSATSVEVKDAKSKGLTRKQEIKLLYPYLEA